MKVVFAVRARTGSGVTLGRPVWHAAVVVAGTVLVDVVVVVELGLVVTVPVVVEEAEAVVEKIKHWLIPDMNVSATF